MVYLSTSLLKMKWGPFIKVIIFLGIVKLIFWSYYLSYNHKRVRIRQKIEKNSIECYHFKEDSLLDISQASPAKNKSIFFHETTCNSYIEGKIIIKARQACAVESAAKQNPNMEVYVLYLSPGRLELEGTESDRFLEAILSYSNVKLYHIDFEKYFKNTIVDVLLKEEKIYNSSFPQIHASDVLRYLTLWKYGGIYLDLDVIVTKSLQDLPLNFAAKQSENEIATGVLSFSSTGDGHKLSTFCLEDLRDNFDGQQWSHNSNGVLSRVLEKHCRKLENTTNIECLGNFLQYPLEQFYPIPWQLWEKYFDPTALEEVKEKSKDSYMLHVWNKLSSESKIPVNNTDVPYIAFAEKYCPKVFAKTEEFF